ncbi:MAG TPA: hypothetical protein VFG10_18615 [Saprospiraceae bacterium]|nr:hypothetical protein [Saprospiraceae bacterium]
MKNLLLFLLVIFGITSCSKDSLDQMPDPKNQPEKSEIKISVTYLHWTDQCDYSCGNSGEQSLSSIANANVVLYSGERSDSDVLSTPLMNIKTNTEGTALIENIEPATYTIYVDTPLGKKARIVTTQLHRRSYIDFSF